MAELLPVAIVRGILVNVGDLATIQFETTSGPLFEQFDHSTIYSDEIRPGFVAVSGDVVDSDGDLVLINLYTGIRSNYTRAWFPKEAIVEIK